MMYQHRLDIAMAMLSSLSEADQKLLISLYEKIKNQIDGDFNQEVGNEKA